MSGYYNSRENGLTKEQPIWKSSSKLAMRFMGLRKNRIGRNTRR